MSERLALLLRDEALDVEVPAAPIDRIRRSGRRLTTRRRVLRGAAGIAAVGLVATTIGLTTGPESPASAAQMRFEKAAAAPAYGTYGAFAEGSTVFIGNHRVTFGERVKALYYTSEGILVRMGRRAITDEPGPSHYTLIHPDGTTRRIDLRMGDRVPATDPQSPNVAYLEPTGDDWSFVVVDLRTGKEVARKVVSGRFTWGGWEAPPASMSGDRVWGLFDEGWRELNWRTGVTRLVAGTRNAPLQAAHGLFASYDEVGQPDWKITDFVTGDIVRTVPMPQENYGGALSPDGRYLRLNGSYPSYDEDGTLVEPPGPSRFLTVATGKIVKIPGRVIYGWTPDGNALVVDPTHDRMTVCDPGTGHCDHIDLEIGGGKIKLGGLPYES